MFQNLLIVKIVLLYRLMPNITIQVIFYVSKIEGFWAKIYWEKIYWEKEKIAESFRRINRIYVIM